MTNDYEKSGMLPIIDEAKYLLSEHPSLRRRDLTPEEIATSVVDMLETYAGVKLTEEQRSDAALVLGTLPEDDVSMERFVANCETHPGLSQLVASLRERLDGPWRLL